MAYLTHGPAFDEELAQLAAEPFKPEEFGFEVDYEDLPFSWTYAPEPRRENHIFHIFYSPREWRLTGIFRQDSGFLGEAIDLYCGRIPTAEFGRQLLENIGDPEEGTNFPFPQNTITPENVPGIAPFSGLENQ